MSGTPMSYFMYGLVLVIVFAGIIVYNYSKKNHDKIEQAKYNMLDDDDEQH